jgi:hypothetical protein
MKTTTTSQRNENSHILPSAAEAPQTPSACVPATVAISRPLDPEPETPIPSRVPNLPQSILRRKFRALSFAARLTDVQRMMLSTWLCNEDYSIEDIRKKVAAPSPDGFGMDVQPTTLRRLRKFSDNTRVTGWISDAMDTACDILEDEDAGENAPIHQALTAMLYSRALQAAQKQDLPETIDKLVTTIAKMEKLKRPAQCEKQSRPATTRHRVELSIVPANPSPQTPPKVIDLTSTALPVTHEPD